jgi:hypothetical protein
MKFRLRSAHYFPGDMYLIGDRETGGDSGGTIVGDGTQYPVVALSKRPEKEQCMTPTLEMVPLDEEAEEALLEEQARIDATAGSMIQIEELAQQMAALSVSDKHEVKYVPGFDNARRGK